jgi:hypothetical protein
MPHEHAVPSPGEPQARDTTGNRMRGTFRMIPDALWTHQSLELIDIKVWCALCLHARDEWYTASSNASLAASAETSVPTLKRSLSRLSQTGFVRIEGATSRRVLHLVPDAEVAVFTLRLAHG